jgi:RHS repeat-associated protein
MQALSYANGGTRTETHYRDGTLQSVTGSAVHRVRYEYGIESGNYTTGDADDAWQCYTVEVKLNPDGSDSSEWTRTYTDTAGRTYKTIYADSTTGVLSDNPYSKAWYNNQGLLWKQGDPDGVITLHTFNAKAEREYSITVPSDVASGLPDYGTLLSSLNSLQAGTNPITRTVRSVVPAGGGRPDMVRTDTYVWLDGQSTGRLASRAETSTAGLDSWQTVYRDDSTPVVTHSQTAYQGGGARSATAIAPDSSYSTSAYANGRLTSVTRKDSTGAQIGKTTIGYDPHGRQATATDARNGTTTYAFNDADLVTSTTTPNPGVPGGNAQTTTTYYNPMLQATNVVQPDGGSVSMEYYLTGQLKRQFGSRTFPVGYGYDYAGRLNLMTNWSGFPNGGARVTTWNYSPYRGWLDNKRHPDSQGPSYTYTAAGRLNTRTWARAVTTTYGYDYAGALSTINYSDSTPAVSYTRDRLGRPRTVLWSGITATFTNNLAGELMGEIYSGGLLAGLSVTNGYDQFLRRMQLAALNSTTPFLQHAFTFDNASRLQTVTDNSAGTAYSATYAYLANSPLVSQITFKQSTATRMTTTKQYDYLNRLSSVRALNSQQSTISSYDYQLNAANQRIRNVMADGSYWLYEYDALGQVRSGRKYWADGTPVAGQQFEYAHDDIGNRTATKAGGDQIGGNLRSASYGANFLNQYTNRTVPGAVDVLGVSFATNTLTVNTQTAYRKGEYFRKEVSVSNGATPVWQSVTVQATGQTDVTGNVFVPKNQEQFSYDQDGNLTNDGRWSYTWDAENRLVAMTNNTAVGPPQGLKFEYDWGGRRIHKQVWSQGSAPTNNVKFVYDGWNLLGEINATNNAVIRLFMWGSDQSGMIQGAGGVGGLLEFVCKGAQTTNCFVAFDGNGNVAALTDAGSASILAQFEYGPFGEVIRATGPMAKVNPFRFSTKYQDDETDLLYYLFRYYSASTGRWLGRDPIAENGGLNLYGFVYNNPPNLVDKDGRIVPILIVAAIAGIYFSTEEYANAPGPGDPTYSGLTGDNILAFADIGVVLSAKLAQGLSRCLCKPVCSRLVPGGGLGAHEAAGGHALGRHVPQQGATAAQIQSALASRLAADASIPAASAFSSRAIAEEAIVDALEASQGAICSWLSGSASRLVVTHAAGAPVGVVLARGAASPTAAREVVVVLDKVAPQSGLCFRITTAYPK